MDDRIRTLIEYGDQLFEKRLSLMSLWQEIADNFYPERADFTVSRNLGIDFAANLSTSYPLLVRRDLGNSFSAMLRPVDQEWFSTITTREDKVDNQGKRWLEWATGLQRRAMYDRKTQFVRATKEGDHDFAAFGQCVLSGELYYPQGNIKPYPGPNLLYRCWHLRDVAWCEGADGRISEVHRKWKPTARDLSVLFPKTISEKTKRLLEKTPYDNVQVRHVVIPSGQYDGPKKWNTPYVSVYFETESGQILEETGTHNPIYIIPRWQTVSGSQYAFSPATFCALSDARLIQAMTLTLLEAGEKAVNPPLVAVQEAIRSDIQIFAGGITAVDAEYDERLGEVLRPITQDLRGLPTGMEMRNDVKSIIMDAFFLNKIGLPPVAGGREMTALETSERVREYIRNALPLFEPLELDYNGAICEHTFELLQRAGAFGNPDDIPQSIRGSDIQFRFESPLHQAIERKKGQIFQEASGLLAQAVATDPSSAAIMDSRAAIRDALNGIGVPAAWVRDEQQMQDIDMQNAERQKAQEMLAMMTQGGVAAKSIADAGASMQSLQA